jgi:hypothetical protein
MSKIIDRKFKILAVNPVKGKIYTEENAVLFAAKDKALIPALLKYYEACEKLGCDSTHLESIKLLMERVEKFQAENESRVPDTDAGPEADRCILGVGLTK